MSGHVLAIDLGSSGLKVAVVDDDGRVIGAASEALPTIFTADGGAEQDPEHWWAALGRCSRQAIAHADAQPGDIDAVAVTAQYMSTLAIAADGRPLTNVVMWMDGRGAPFIEGDQDPRERRAVDRSPRSPADGQLRPRPHRPAPPPAPRGRHSGSGVRRAGRLPHRSPDRADHGDAEHGLPVDDRRQPDPRRDEPRCRARRARRCRPGEAAAADPVRRDHRHRHRARRPSTSASPPRRAS